MDPDKRLTAEQTLQHPYLIEYHDPNDEPTFDGCLVSDEYSAAYSDDELDTSSWKGNNIASRFVLSCNYC